MEDLKKIEVCSVKEIEYTDEKGAKRKFKAYKAVLKNGKLIDLKFTRTVTETPVKAGYIYVHPCDVNIQSNLKYPIMWVKHVVRFEDYPNKSEEDLF